ncbi:LysE family translocator [Roseateles sp. DAIF2]|uniref:LysE family translocator n=1 Tax=Roseateles sp. DAIF2 TaxID=2714952 RepID=UPI0018A26899|nr:LysE family translocator [Roseateles sp. DAIF2]QPF72386.1 LysE family translocator [Roseateles sp. DAIF2]
MDFASWLAFVGVALVVAFSPGPAVLLAISNSLAHGAGRAMIGALGNALGLLIVAAAATLGLGALLQTSATAFLLLKLVGAAYLIYLGVRQWRQRASAFDGIDEAAAARERPSARRLFANGLTVALTNPKAILFFTALFPQFLREASPASEQFLVLVLSFSGCVVLAHGFYVLLARALRRRLSSARRVQALNRLFGAGFVAIGVSLLGLRAKAVA